MKQKYSIINGEITLVEDGQDYAWLELINPTPEEIDTVVKKYKLPEDYFFDINDPFELPRTEGLEDDKPNLFILDYPIKLKKRSFTTRPVAIISVDGIIITVRNSETTLFEDLKSVNTRIKSNEDIENLVIEIAWTISRAFIYYVKAINKEIDYIENKIKKSSNTKDIYSLIDIQKSLINFEAANRENGPVIESLFDLEGLDNSHSRESLLRDLQVENKQASVMIQKSSYYIDHLSDLYSNVISNNMNMIMKVLTSITIIMTVPTIIGGLWGMNTNLPLENHPNAFWILIGLPTLISLIIFYFLRKKDYL